MGDYHDYVIKDGELIGKFEDMYRESDQIPWHQNKTSFDLHADMDICALKRLDKKGKFKNILDIGCGMGYFSDRIRKEVFPETDIDLISSDISKTAILSANKNFNDIDFITLDIMKDDISRFANKFDLIIFRELLWYVCSDIDDFTKRILSMLKDNGIIYLSQWFPDHEKFYGQEIFPNESSIIKYFDGHFNCIFSHIISENDNTVEDEANSFNRFVRYVGKK